MSLSWRCGLVLRTVAALSCCAVSAPLFAEVPNINGVWNRYPPYADTFSNEPDPPELQLVEPPLKEPYLAQWRALQAKRAAADAEGKPLPTPSSRCLPEGAPGIMGAHYALQILQNPELHQITVLGEFMSQVRRIYLDEALPPIDSIDPGYFGYSAAKWRGDVLEVTTAGIREDVQYADIPHSAGMMISERIYLKSADILIDDVTVKDPQYLTRPYNFTFMYKREPNSYKVGEYVCDDDHSYVTPDGTLNMRLGGSGK